MASAKIGPNDEAWRDIVAYAGLDDVNPETLASDIFILGGKISPLAIYARCEILGRGGRYTRECMRLAMRALAAYDLGHDNSWSKSGDFLAYALPLETYLFLDEKS